MFSCWLDLWTLHKDNISGHFCVSYACAVGWGGWLSLETQLMTWSWACQALSRILLSGAPLKTPTSTQIFWKYIMRSDQLLFYIGYSLSKDHMSVWGLIDT